LVAAAPSCSAVSIAARVSYKSNQEAISMRHTMYKVGKGGCRQDAVAAVFW
jgi:hypothetical protein